MRKRNVFPYLEVTPKEILGVFWSNLVDTYPELPRKYPDDIDLLIQLNEGTPLHALLRQAKALVSKVPSTGPAMKIAALETWLQSEKSCEEANRRIPLLRLDRDSPLWRIMDRANALVRQVLGDFTHHKYCLILDLARDGPGVSLLTNDRERTAPVYKSLSEYTRQTCSPSAVGMAIDFYRQHPKLIWRELRSRQGSVSGAKRGIAVTPANRVGFVPKSSKTFRSIAIEPSLNLRLQLGVHDLLAPILERKHVSVLSDQRVNQLLAKLGTRSTGLDGLATIDLSAASDTISIELVRWLLPEAWFDFLSLLRCTHSDVEGKRYELNKFSSMGNGFTFVLESLIFWALSESCRIEANAPYLSMTYGDDIICPSASALLLVETLQELGLTVNTNKSFFHGPFRESCGADWSAMKLVTPVFLRRRKVSLQDCHRLLNHFGTLKTCAPLRQYLLSKYSDVHPLIFGLENELDDSCIFAPLAYVKGIGQLKWSPSLQTYRFKGLVTLGRSFVEDEDLSCLSALHGGTRSTPRRGATRTLLRWLTAGRPVGVQLLMS
jgi:hypothetical protein